jgi:hypothetical protein
VNRFCRIVLTWLSAAFCATGALAQTTPHYLIINNNHPEGNFATFFTLAKNGTFAARKRIATGGKGIATPVLFAPAAPGVAVFHSTTEDCAFVADPGTNDIAAIDSNLQAVGRFHGGPLDINNFASMALAINKDFLYAAFTGKANSKLGGRLGSFRILSGCQLEFLGSVPAVGTGFNRAVGRYPIALAAHDKILILVYGDGSIESFHFSNGKAESNGDLQNSTGAKNSQPPLSVDITQDAKFAIFGDVTGCSPNGEVEVANISTGKLSEPTIIYSMGADTSETSHVRLSPDESLLYLNGDAIAFFDKTTGAATYGCFNALKDPDEGRTTEWWLIGNVALADNASGTGGTIYSAEDTLAVGTAGNDQYVGFQNVTSNGQSCTLTESPKSNFEMQSNSADFGTVATWPPRAF